MGSGITDLGSGSQPRDRDHGPGIPGHKSWDPDRPIRWDQNGIRIKCCHILGIRNQNLELKFGISDEKIYLVTTLSPGLQEKLTMATVSFYLKVSRLYFLCESCRTNHLKRGKTHTHTHTHNTARALG